eukprot:CAMPEP_0117748030 /NCGR_PEP_ID=MMETSP0947-20121206/8841_1 /TAXON_ID=44440 /ORGANISM="Chattonella subsalsa, Strain CCMP2191" /LENGTH=249 /DNA_ID=CAMNT_0005565551 /DNA_START=30 /DNA_END=776 /DNA_ORIENTATION=+
MSIHRSNTVLMSIILITCTCFFTAKAVQVTVILRGNKYDVSADTVSDIQKQIQKQTGLSLMLQSVLYKGSFLESEDNLIDIGVSDGDILNVVPNRRPKTSRKKYPLSSSSSFLPTHPNEAPSFDDPNVQKPVNKSIRDNLSAEELLSMPAEQMQSMLDEVWDPELMNSLLNDPEQLEFLRQAMLQHPLTQKMIEIVPYLSEYLNDPEKWRQHLTKAIHFQNLIQEARKKTQSFEKKQQDTHDDESSRDF